MSVWGAFRRIFKFADRDIEMFEQNVAEKFRADNAKTEALVAAAGGTGNLSNVVTQVKTVVTATRLPGDGTTTLGLTADHTSITGKRIIWCAFTGQTAWSALPVNGVGTFATLCFSNLVAINGGHNAIFLVDNGLGFDGATVAGSWVSVCDAQIGNSENVVVYFQFNAPGANPADEFEWQGTLVVADYLEAA